MPRRHPRWSLATTAAVLWLSVATLQASAAAMAGTTETPLATPTAVTATAGPGNLTVSWKPLAASGITYTVVNQRGVTVCTVVATSSCTLVPTSLAPSTYRVRATSVGATSPTSGPTKALPLRLVVVVAGQSNAVGAASYAIDPVTKVNYLAAPYANGADRASTITWSIRSEHTTPSGTFAPLDTPQVYQAEPGSPQVFGPEIGLARSLYTDGIEAISIIKFAASNTSLGVNWLPPMGTLEAGLIAYVHTQLMRLAASGTVGLLAATYWYQGESDAMNPVLAASYQAGLEQFITTVRSALPFTPGAPFVLAKESLAQDYAQRLASGSCTAEGCAAEEAWDAAVRHADDAVAGVLPNIVEVDTVGLPRNTVGIHLTSIGELKLGAALAAASRAYLKRFQ